MTKCLVAIALGVALLAAHAQVRSDHVSDATVNDIAAQFRNTQKSTGMAGNVGAIQQCYQASNRNPDRIARCMLWDISAVKFDNAMHQVLAQRNGRDPGPVSPYLTLPSFKQRLDSYGVIALGPNAGNRLQTYYGDAPERVTAALNQ